ncbi:MAG: TetR/AcrR family transcriptional regulator [Thermoleophilaceae bacterium]
MTPTVPTRQGSRRRVPRAEREQLMLDAAGTAFANRGFHAASMDAIAEAAGISKPMLYSYFGSKEGLYVAYVERSGYDLLEKMRLAAPRDATREQRLRAGILAFLAHIDDHRAGWAVLSKEASSQGDPLAARLTAMRLRVAGMLLGLLGSEAFAHAFVGASESLANWWLDHPDVPREEIAQLLMRVARISMEGGG